MAITDYNDLTPREWTLMQAEQEEAKLAREHDIAVKSLELNLARENNAAEITLKTLQAKWATWLQLPRLIILLPLFVLFGMAYVCSMFTKKEMPKRFWDLLM